MSTSKTDGNKMPRWIVRLNNRIVNPIQRLWAPYLPPLAIVIHRGRKTDTEYRTPVMAFKHRGQLIIPLPYGDQTQWLRNLRASGYGEIVRAGHRSPLADFRISDGTAAADDLPVVLRRTLRSFRILIAQA